MNRRPLILSTLVCLIGCDTPDPPPIDHAERDPEVSAEWGKADAPGEPISHLGHGTWLDPERQGRYTVVSAWVDARVVNHRYHKRVFAEVDVPFADGSHARSLWPMAYEAPAGDAERWGTSAIELYPDGGPFGAAQSGPAGARLRVQYAVGGEEKMWVGPWFTLDAEGGYLPAASDPWGQIVEPAPSGAGELAVSFGPMQDTGRPIVDEIEAVIAAQRADPDGRHTLHAAIYDLSNEDIVDRLIEAHLAGVEVRLITDPKKLRPWAHWLRSDDRLRRAGVPLLSVHQPHGAMHLKVGLFDGRAVTTGSANWADSGRWRNDEYTLWSDDPTIYAGYAAAFRALAGGVAESTGPVILDRDIGPRIIELIDGAQVSIHAAMFTAKDYARRGRTVFDALHDAIDRGVEVVLVTDARFSRDDETDERLEAAGAYVLRVDNPHDNHAVMHDKFAVFDGETAAVGAVNWYHDALFYNAEDMLLLDAPDVVEAFAGEIVDLQARYDPDFDPEAHPAGTVEFSVRHRDTRYGETVVVVGGLEALGGWKPERAVRLDASRWPDWRGTIELPVGRHFEWKLAVVGPYGVRFERGANRVLRVRATNEVEARWR